MRPECLRPGTRDPYREAITHLFDGSPLIGPEKRKKVTRPQAKPTRRNPLPGTSHMVKSSFPNS
jgi:hypothetical protein